MIFSTVNQEIPVVIYFGTAYEVPKLNLYLNFVEFVKPLVADSNVCEHGKL